MSTEVLGNGMTDCDYVEYMLTIENGKVVGAEFFGEGTQLEPLDGVKVYVPAGEIIYPQWIKHLERRIKSLFRKKVDDNPKIS